MDPSNFKFLKVGKFGKSTILQRNALTTTQMHTICLEKVYTIVVRDPPIFDFLESVKFWKVYNSTKKCAINNSDAYLLTSQSLQRYGKGSTNF